MQTTAYEPQNDFLLVRPMDKEKYQGKIYIPEQYQKQSNEGEVLKVGPLGPQELLGCGVVFAGSSEYRVQVETGEVLYVIPANQILLSRKLQASKKHKYVAEEFAQVADDHRCVVCGEQPEHNNHK